MLTTIKRAILLLLLSYLGLWGCTSRASVTLGPTQIIEFDVAYYLDMEEFVRVANNRNNSFSVQLKPILNSFWGRPDAEIGMSFSIDSDSSTWFRSEQFQSALDRLLQNHPPQARNTGLRITPSNTRFARFGTFAEGEGSISFGTNAFIDQNSEQFLLLTYFDRSCELTGRNSAGGELFEFDIKIPKAGYYWLVMEKLTATSFLVKKHSSNTIPTFAIQLPSRNV